MQILLFLLGAIFGAVVMIHIYAIILKRAIKFNEFKDSEGVKYNLISIERRVIIIYDINDFNAKQHDL